LRFGFSQVLTFRLWIRRVYLVSRSASEEWSMSDEQKKLHPVEQKKDAGDHQKPVTSQKTANEAVSDDPQAKMHAENFSSLSHDTKALGKHVIADNPLILHDSKTNETLYDASKRHGKVLEQVAPGGKSGAKQHGADAKAGEKTHVGESTHSGEKTHVDEKSHAGSEKHMSAGQRIVEFELARQAEKIQKAANAGDASSVAHKIPVLDSRPGGAERQPLREAGRGASRGGGGQDQGRAHSEAGQEHGRSGAGQEQVRAANRNDGARDVGREVHRSDSVRDTARGDKPGVIAQEFSVWIPDYKTLASPAILPKLVEVHMTPADNIEIDRHYRETLHGRDESTLSDFDRQKLKNLAICDVAIDRYQQALTRSELHDTKNMPDQVRGFMLAGCALEDGAALGATKAVLHKVIEGGAIGDLASGTAMGMAFGKVVGTLAASINPVTRGIALALRTGGVALAIKEIGELGTKGVDGLMKSVPSLQELCNHPSEKSFAHAKESVEDHLGDPLADATLVGLGFAAAHGMEKALPGGAKGGGKSHAGEHHEAPGRQGHGEEHAGRSSSGRDGSHNDGARRDGHAEPTSRDRVSRERDSHREKSVEAQKHKDVSQEVPKVSHSEYSCTDSAEGVIRTLKCGEHEQHLIRRRDWYCSMPRVGENVTHSPIKVHVLTDSPADLAKVQNALIPELLGDKVLIEKVGQWKGQDPMVGVGGEAHPNSVQPTGVGQGAKGFTIYSATAEDALIVQRRIDAILHEKGLSLKEEFKTGNTEECPGLSKRVSICRDTFEQGLDDRGLKGPLVDEPVARDVHQRYGLKPGQRLSPENIRDLETHTGIMPGGITYSTDGRLMVRSKGGQADYHSGYYAVESGVDTSMGKRVERPALYALYRACGFDPCDPAVIWKKK
jgi:hypothetical protein